MTASSGLFDIAPHLPERPTRHDPEVVARLADDAAEPTYALVSGTMNRNPLALAAVCAIVTGRRSELLTAIEQSGGHPDTVDVLGDVLGAVEGLPDAVQVEGIVTAAVTSIIPEAGDPSPEALLIGRAVMDTLRAEDVGPKLIRALTASVSEREAAQNVTSL